MHKGGAGGRVAAALHRRQHRRPQRRVHVAERRLLLRLQAAHVAAARAARPAGHDPRVAGLESVRERDEHADRSRLPRGVPVRRVARVLCLRRSGRAAGAEQRAQRDVHDADAVGRRAASAARPAHADDTDGAHARLLDALVRAGRRDTDVRGADGRRRVRDAHAVAAAAPLAHLRPARAAHVRRAPVAVAAVASGELRSLRSRHVGGALAAARRVSHGPDRCTRLLLRLLTRIDFLILLYLLTPAFLSLGVVFLY